MNPHSSPCSKIPQMGNVVLHNCEVHYNLYNCTEANYNWQPGACFVRGTKLWANECVYENHGNTETHHQYLVNLSRLDLFKTSCSSILRALQF